MDDLNKVFNHLFYIDIFKLFVKDENEGKGLFNTVNFYNDDIDVEFGWHKMCKSNVQEIEKYWNAQ